MPQRSADSRPLRFVVSTAGRALLAVVLVLQAGVRLVGSGPSGAPSGPAAAADSLLPILTDELRRNIDGLKKEPVPPYFASYTVYDVQTASVRASFGALIGSHQHRSRSAVVDVRVGDYALDNTREIRGDRTAAFMGFSRTALPLPGARGEPADAVRAVLWRATDRKFKQAAERYTKVKTNVAAKVQDGADVADLSREPPQTFTEPALPPPGDVAPWEGRLRRISAPFGEQSLVLSSDATLTVETTRRYFVSTEGSQIVTSDTTARLMIAATTKADDGMELPLYRSYFATSADRLPSEAQLVADVREMVTTLDALRSAPVIDPYTGPAILSGRAAGVFFHEIFGHRIEGHRTKQSDDAQTFAKRLNSPVLPAFLSVVFDPTLERDGDTELVGHYAYDDEGVKARRVVAVDHGVLKAFLMSRSPVAGILQSNGHGRAMPGLAPVSRQSNLVVEAGEAVPFDDLMARLKREIRQQGRPFGLFFQNIEGGFTFTGRMVPNAFNVLPNLVYRVYPDDRPMELVRGVDLIGTPLTTFARILAASRERETFNGMCGAESGLVPVSASSPALLVGEVEVQKKLKSQEGLPVLPAPPGRAKSE
jgi:predicted Zn-dependent protease